MGPVLVESTENGKKAYKSLLLEPRKLSVLNSELALEIVKELTMRPGCALDIARSLQQDEQKIYYYLRKLEAAGIVKLSRTERRHGMTAKIYGVIAPVIATKLHDDAHEMPGAKTMPDPGLTGFMSPFIKNGKLNAVVVIGNPYSHGRFDSFSKEAPYAFDFAMFLGSLMTDFAFPHYKLDTEVTEEDLHNNLVLVGNIKSNVVIDKVNESLPFFFETKSEFGLVSRNSGKNYTDPRIGMVMNIENPFCPGKRILIIGGVGSRGSRSAIITLTQHCNEMANANSNGNCKDFACLMRGFDKNGDGIIDDIEFLE